MSLLGDFSTYDVMAGMVIGALSVLAFGVVFVILMVAHDEREEKKQKERKRYRELIEEVDRLSVEVRKINRKLGKVDDEVRMDWLNFRNENLAESEYNILRGIKF